MTITVEPQAEVQSPFLEGTNIQFAWDSTSLGYLKTCPRLYEYVMIRGYGEAEEGIHLKFGRVFHSAFEEYAKVMAEGEEHDVGVIEAVHHALINTAGFAPDPETKAGKYKNRSMLIRAIIWGLDQYKDDPAHTYILQSKEPAVELSFQFDLDWGPQAAMVEPQAQEGNDDDEDIGPYLEQPYVICGHLDRVVTFQDELYVLDYKTTMTTPGSYYFDQYDPNNQMTLYTLASQIILDAPVKGVIINAVQLMLDYEKSGAYGSRFVRGFTFRTKGRLDEWIVDLKVWLQLAELYATQNYWPQNDTSCDKFGGCRFREVCSKDPKVRDKYLKNFTKLTEEEKWNPLKPR
jgi:hypothetical protein